MKVIVEFIDFAKQNKTLREDSVNISTVSLQTRIFTKIMLGNSKNFNIEKSYSKSKSFLDFKKNVIFSQFCETKTNLRQVCVEFKHYHFNTIISTKIMSRNS